jgi:predicted metalloendopeptidase
VKKERALQLVTLDPHGPNEMRCNGTLSNVPEFVQVSCYEHAFCSSRSKLCMRLIYW